MFGLEAANLACISPPATEWLQVLLTEASRNYSAERLSSKFHFGPRNYASGPNIHFSDNTLAADIISRHTSRPKGFISFITPILKSLVVPVIWLALIGAIYSWIAPFFALYRIFFPAN